MSLTNFTASLIGRAVILVIMYVELYVTDKLHIESNRTSCDTSDNVCRAAIRLDVKFVSDIQLYIHYH
jgi:hypothetical protein